MSKERVVIAMSGGVDSCVAAALLQKQGYDVVGITMQLWNHGGDGDGRFDSCCSLSDVHDARRTAHRLGIPHYVVNYEKEFKQGVVDYFAKEYSAGRTPNPCVMCNSKLKFDHLIERASAIGAKWVATGHYARLEHFDDGRPPALYKGLDDNKDQSYFLFDTNPENLKRAMFPLGHLSKPEVRAIAAEMGMHTATKHESQEICFVTGKRYTDFLEQHYADTFHGQPGEIKDRSGQVLGTHDGIYKFTVGQRKGLGHLGLESPKYVAEINAKTHTIIVDDLENLAAASLDIAACNWLVSEAELLDPEMVYQVMVRYRAKPVACRLKKIGDRRYQVLLAEKTRWVSPGQAAVIYQGDRVLGGGFIAKSESKTESNYQAPNRQENLSQSY